MKILILVLIVGSSSVEQQELYNFLDFLFYN